MRKEDISLVNQLLLEMRRLTDVLAIYLKKQDFEGVLNTKKQLEILQKKVDKIL